jgi:cysteine desulfurase family protein (TIGR01976 family)
VTFDVNRVRAAYPALSDGFAYLDGAAGTQVPATVIEAITDAYRSGIGNVGGTFPASDRSGAIVAECRQALADLTGASPDGVVLGPNMTTLTYRLAEALSRRWEAGDEIVVSRLDHDANIRPWVQAAARRGATVRWAEVDLATTELPAAQYGELLSERTRLVAVTAASNVVGTRPDLAAIAAAAHAVGALVYVDGVHATPHIPVDVAAFGADFYATSAYKWSGPHIGTVVADPALLDSLHPDKLAPAPADVPGRFERGTAAFADLAGAAAAVDHLASLGSGPGTSPGASRRQRVLVSMAAVEEYETRLFARLRDGLEAMGHVTSYGRAALRAPTAFFTVAGQTPRQVAEHLAARQVNVWNGDNYAWELAGALGLRDSGGAVRAGLVHYNDQADVDRLLAAVAELA